MVPSFRWFDGVCSEAAEVVPMRDVFLTLRFVRCNNSFNDVAMNNCLFLLLEDGVGRVRYVLVNTLQFLDLWWFGRCSCLPHENADTWKLDELAARIDNPQKAASAALDRCWWCRQCWLVWLLAMVTASSQWSLASLVTVFRKYQCTNERPRLARQQ